MTRINGVKVRKVRVDGQRVRKIRVDGVIVFNDAWYVDWSVYHYSKPTVIIGPVSGQPCFQDDYGTFLTVSGAHDQDGDTTGAPSVDIQIDLSLVYGHGGPKSWTVHKTAPIDNLELVHNRIIYDTVTFQYYDADYISVYLNNHQIVFNFNYTDPSLPSGGYEIRDSGTVEFQD